MAQNGQAFKEHLLDFVFLLVAAWIRKEKEAENKEKEEEEKERKTIALVLHSGPLNVLNQIHFLM